MTIRSHPNCPKHPRKNPGQYPCTDESPYYNQTCDGCPRTTLEVGEGLKVVVANQCERLAMGGKAVETGQATALGAVLGLNKALTKLSLGNAMGKKNTIIEGSNKWRFEYEGKPWLKGAGFASVLSALAKHEALQELYGARGVRMLWVHQSASSTDLAARADNGGLGPEELGLDAVVGREQPVVLP